MGIKAIRTAAMAVLAGIDGNTDAAYTIDLTGTNQVMPGRYDSPPQRRRVDFACIYSVGVSSQAAGVPLTQLEHATTFIIMVFAPVKATSGAARLDLVDDIADDLLGAFSAAPTLGGLVLRHTLNIATFPISEDAQNAEEQASWAVAVGRLVTVSRRNR